jgi:hypothetical protein
MKQQAAQPCAQASAANYRARFMGGNGFKINEGSPLVARSPFGVSASKGISRYLGAGLCRSPLTNPRALIRTAEHASTCAGLQMSRIGAPTTFDTDLAQLHAGIGSALQI